MNPSLSVMFSVRSLLGSCGFTVGLFNDPVVIITVVRDGSSAIRPYLSWPLLFVHPNCRQSLSGVHCFTVGLLDKHSAISLPLGETACQLSVYIRVGLYTVLT